MGGTGDYLIDQGDQGDGVDSGVGVRIIGTSPSRTRLGKIVKYKD
jgi:hypothetical protein